MVEKAEKPALDTLSGSGQTQPAGSELPPSGSRCSALGPLAKRSATVAGRSTGVNLHSSGTRFAERTPQRRYFLPLLHGPAS